MKQTKLIPIVDTLTYCEQHFKNYLIQLDFSLTSNSLLPTEILEILNEFNTFKRISMDRIFTYFDEYLQNWFTGTIPTMTISVGKEQGRIVLYLKIHNRLRNDKANNIISAQIKNFCEPECDEFSSENGIFRCCWKENP